MSLFRPDPETPAEFHARLVEYATALGTHRYKYEWCELNAHRHERIAMWRSHHNARIHYYEQKLRSTIERSLTTEGHIPMGRVDSVYLEWVTAAHTYVDASTINAAMDAQLAEALPEWQAMDNALVPPEGREVGHG